MFDDILMEKIEYINNGLNKLLDIDDKPEILYDAMRYSVFAGGKRLRPVLCISSCELVGGDRDDALPVACAIEFIHTYSLIHDDLPAMDNDDLRRGKPTNHKVYGEALAILAGDALLNYGFEVLIHHALDSTNCQNILRATEEVAHAAGCHGMIGGQVVDLLSENKDITEEELKFMHDHKTGALIKASVVAGAIMGGADDETIKKLSDYAKYIGLAFQIKDDILDVLGDESKLGKNAKSDLENGKSTFVSVFGLQRSISLVKELTASAIRILDDFGEKSEFLKSLTKYMADRDS
ncbi:polyprenyl synthetase family protein [Thermoanaerobacterium thermosaccharolyticum]|uniref:polyprenyl synthetase family protein n=1 Tax=Thermoanaerobacterium TaxID=28895 RepID=UPI0026DF0950|nr:farnesyl diphosphate synthase [Thermoanaerobacterium sp. CMT5567-10]WHE08042.1 polyprenyl synthetase family protein [Thermoanaerobacterium thermosaccharolyticum]WKV08999.1 polyprenyl synthetase family protein [Thermoanaerobacterium sp. CMT5567-10]